MNANSQAKVVLCYGDSNTWGQNDDKNFSGRYESDVRWTGKLQNLLGQNFYVIEEGLGGRTTDLEHYNPAKPSCNGYAYFVPCLASHCPLDFVIIMLGTNDLKIQYHRQTAEVANALGKYIQLIKTEAPNAIVLLVSPIHIEDTAPKFAGYYTDTYDNKSVQKSKDLAQVIKNLAERTNVLYFDASLVSKAGSDGIHFDKLSHSALAKSISEIIASM